MICRRCTRFVKAAEMRCYDYRIGWMCVYCEGDLRGVVLLHDGPRRVPG